MKGGNIGFEIQKNLPQSIMQYEFTTELKKKRNLPPVLEEIFGFNSHL